MSAEDSAVDWAAAQIHQRDVMIAALRQALKPFANRVPETMMNGEKPDEWIVAKAGQELGDFRRAYNAVYATT